MKRIIGAHCEWTPLKQFYDLQAIVNRANQRRPQSAIMADLPEETSSCGMKARLWPIALVYVSGDRVGFEVDLASDGKRYLVHFRGEADCTVDESEVRSQIERALCDVPLNDDARRELLGVVQVTSKTTVKMVQHVPFL